MRMNAGEWFRLDRRLGIPLPCLPKPWDALAERERSAIAAAWETIRGAIPDRIKQLEAEIDERQKRMEEEADFAACCRLNGEIAELAGRINELNNWFRTEPDVGPGRSDAEPDHPCA